MEKSESKRNNKYNDSGKEKGYKGVVIPEDNVQEASHQRIDIVPVSTLRSC